MLALQAICRRALAVFISIAAFSLPQACAQTGDEDLLNADPAAAAAKQAELMQDVRQVTFEGKRSGEGYFSADGSQMVFQSEREPGNPFYQIYLMDRENGDVHRVSPGNGKTTCAWIHPDGKKVLFASTQYDQEAAKKMQAELDFRASGKERRYSWDYDETYDLVEFDTETGDYTRLSTEVGYDAEGSYSPDGEWICFASNRKAYEGEMTEKEKELFELDPASAMELYIMRSDGTELRQLTDKLGYDGGPFFSPDGKKICWRRFAENGATAEIMTMNVDGTEQKAITKLQTMSWAPYFHPSGDYLIFTTNRHGFSNFELYLVDAEGKKDPVRATYRADFDGLPVFTPDGKNLFWTSNSGAKNSQIFECKWNDAAARELLGLGEPATELVEAANSANNTAPGFSAADVGRHVDYLCRPELGGRLTGTEGELKATAYVAAYLESLGLFPAGQDGTFFHNFEFVSDVKLGEANALTLGDGAFEVNKQWRPVFFSKEGPVDAAEVVCAGYGIVAPEGENQDEYDSYVHLDVKDKWVLCFRQMPQDIAPERRQHLARFSGERYKSMVARDRGARGIIFVSGPNSPLRSRLVPLRMDGSLSGSSLAVISIDDGVGQQLVKKSGKNLKEIQSLYDSGEPQMGFLLEGVKLAAEVDIEPVKSRGRNVVAILPAGERPAEQMIVVGAHIDHLGTGQGGGSLAKDDEIGGMHRGADDNASGVACMLEIAQYLADQKESGKLNSKRDILFAAWSGEELGLRGSAAFAEEFYKLYPSRIFALFGRSDLGGEEGEEQEPDPSADPHAGIHSGAMPLYPAVTSCINLDMVGRLREKLVLQGIASSDVWKGVIERRNAVVRLALTLQDDCNLPTDASTFYLKGVPILSAFTGSHDEYHTPRDVPELINYEGASQISRLMALITRDLVQAEEPPEYKEQETQPEMRANLTAYLGTVPDYAKEDIKGVLLGGVTKGAPAQKAGIKPGDIIVELAGKKIENIYDYTYAIEALKIGQETSCKVQRGKEVLELTLIPASRQ
ncbi:MAG: M20/M25/M40 family metallo-hydrolase [Planctomycetota bacterium]